MNDKRQNHFSVTTLTAQEVEKLTFWLRELHSGIGHCMDALHMEDAGDDVVLMVAAVPGQPIQAKTVEECFHVLPCFGESDAIAIAGTTGLLLSYDEQQIIQLGEERYLTGPAILYCVDEEGEDLSLTVRDIYAARLWVEEQAVTLCADGKEFPALRLD